MGIPRRHRILLLLNLVVGFLYHHLLLVSLAHGLAASSPPVRLLGNRGDVSSLRKWAVDEGGVAFAPGVEIQQLGDDNNWQIGLVGSDDDNKLLEKGSILLSVPNNLILRSPDVVKEIGRDTLEEALETLATKGGFADQVGEFLIFLKILKEYDLGSKSKWNTWIDCLPRDFSTGICFSSDELDCLPSFSRTLADFEIKKLAAFSHCADLVRPSWEQNRVHTNQQRKTLYQWAYNVVYTRCWKFSDELESTTTEMVPIGDLFNHGDPATVAVEEANNNNNPTTDEEATVDFILQTTADNIQNSGGSGGGGGLTLSYGLTTNPHRFLVIFGFVDESMSKVFSQVTFPQADDDHIALGCNDRTRMVYDVNDGAISGTIWDCVLYALLASQPEERTALVEAHQQGDLDTKKALYAKYALETSLTLRNHVDGTLKELKVLEQAIIQKTSSSSSGKNKKKNQQQHPNLPLIGRQNAFLQGVFQKVKSRLDGMVQEETIRRRSAAAGAS